MKDVVDPNGIFFPIKEAVIFFVSYVVILKSEIVLVILKLSASLLKQKKQTEFYEEVLKALWGYIADKLNIPQEQLNKDNIQSRLEERGADLELIQEFIDVLNCCEFARYAPSGGNFAMESVYDRAIGVISKMEGQIKSKKNR